jgi:hypothetical protein
MHHKTTERVKEFVRHAGESFIKTENITNDPFKNLLWNVVPYLPGNDRSPTQERNIFLKRYFTKLSAPFNINRQ